MTMKIVILAQEQDNHTAPLKWALEQGGYQVACWGGLAWFTERQASLAFSERAQLILGPHPLEPGDVVWIRRPEEPAHQPQSGGAGQEIC